MGPVAMRKPRTFFVLCFFFVVYGHALVPVWGETSGAESGLTFKKLVSQAAAARKSLITPKLVLPGQAPDQSVGVSDKDAGDGTEAVPETAMSLPRKSEFASVKAGVCGRWTMVRELLMGAMPKCVMREDLLAYVSAQGNEGNTKHWPKFEVNTRMVVGTILAFCGAALANAGGVGGGGLFVPLFNLLLGFDAKTSAALSKAMVLGGSLASYSFNVQLRNPLGDASLINYSFALLLMPFLVLGISTGVTLNVIFPGWLIILLLTVFLVYTTYGVTRQGLKTYAQENRLHAQQAEQVLAQQESHAPTASAASNEGEGHSDYEELPGEDRQCLVNGGDWSSVVGYPDNPPPIYVSTQEVGVHLLDLDDVEGPVGGGGLSSPRVQGPVSPRAPRLPKRNKSMVELFHMGEPTNKPFWKFIDWRALVQLIFIWLLFFSIQVTKTHTALCGRAYWLLTFSQIPLAVLATLSGALQMLHKQREQAELERLTGVPASVAEVRWSTLEVTTYPLYALLAGTCGGLLGIGGGMVLGPVLLALKIHPQVTSATTSFMVVFSAAMSVTEFYLLGRIPINFALFFSALCMVAALFGLSIVRALVVRSGHASIIIFVLAAVIGISGLVIGSVGTANIVSAYFAGEYMGFHSMCGE